MTDEGSTRDAGAEDEEGPRLRIAAAAVTLVVLAALVGGVIVTRQRVSVEVPDVTGGTNLRGAERAVESAGLMVGQLDRTSCDMSLRGVIVRQNPAPGTNLTPGSTVDITVCG